MNAPSRPLPLAGRWPWHENGIHASPFEEQNRHASDRNRDRFGRGLLVDYLAALGIVVDDPSFSGSGTSIRDRVNYDVRRETTEQVRARFGW
jgi:hypothetical protein